MTRKQQFEKLIADVAAEQSLEMSLADKKIRESSLGNMAPFILGLMVGALVKEYGAEETDRLLMVFVTTIAAQQKAG